MRTLVLIGETASGKTAFSLQLAKKLDCEIINADAFQCYKGIEISTAQPNKEEQSCLPHHLYGFLEVEQPINIAIYQKLAREKIEEIHSRGKSVLFVGGAGLYIRAALYDYKFPETRQLEEDLQSKSNQELYKLLLEADEESAREIHPNNRVRIIRALELALSGHPKSSNAKVEKEKPLYEAEFYRIDIDRETLYDRISKRVDKMVDLGLVDEVRSMLGKHPHDSPAFRAIGFKEMIPYVEGHISLEQALEDVKKDTRNYAKRQNTFFKHQFAYKLVRSVDEIN